MSKTSRIIPGIYRHYKGNRYRVFEIATHSETGEKLVVYRCLYGDHDLWVRPLEMFASTVEVDGCLLKRFELIEAGAIKLGEE